MIIDFHTHIFESNIAENRSSHFDDQTFSLLYSADKSKIADHKALLRAMEESGIDHAVAMGFPWEKEKYCERQNKYFSDIKKNSGGKIIPFGSLPLGEKLEIDDWVSNIKDIGLAGIGEIAFYNEGLTYKKTDILQELFASAEKHSLPVCLHVSEPVGHDYTGKHLTDLATLYTLINDFPNMTIILAHWGGGLFFYELMDEVRNVLKNVFYDTAATPFLYREEIFETAVKIIGHNKILFGSDFPLINFKKYIASIEKFVPDENGRKNILGENASAILKNYPELKPKTASI
jgi:uncharacterized protein